MKKTKHDLEVPMPKAAKLAVEHVDWLLCTIRPLLIDQFVHGHKHGYDDAEADRQE